LCVDAGFRNRSENEPVRVDLLAGTEATHVLAVPNIVHCRKFTDHRERPWT
jgi:hypothetical protein